MSRSRRVPDGTRADAELRRPLKAFAAGVMRLGEVDPVTTEMVRLRCASYHDCHT